MCHFLNGQISDFIDLELLSFFGKAIFALDQPICSIMIIPAGNLSVPLRKHC